MRLNNYISATGVCSRREADEYIKQNRVTVNGQAAELGMQVKEEDVVCLDGKILKAKPSFVTIAYNKPIGITCTTEPEVEGNIIKAVGYPERIFPIGRLDKDSEGLILLTGDGSLVNKILRAENNHDKEYIVRVSKPIDKKFISAMEKGVEIYNPVKNERTVTMPCKIKMINSNSFGIILKQGLNRQIRRMCSALGYKVISLKRIRIMNITLDSLPSGKWRKLTSEEMNILTAKTEKV